MVGIILLQPSGIFCNLLIQSIYDFDFKGVAVDLHPPGNGTKEFNMFLNSNSISVVKQLSGIGKKHNYLDRGSFHLTQLEGYVAIHFLLIDMSGMGRLAIFPCCFTPIIDGNEVGLAVSRIAFEGHGAFSLRTITTIVGAS
ncbi:hypothetical protein E3N88_26897 [Mikania micrantha]|uniref:Uncharacterized protein n=1 Tax=Mikania micrantha TaxID=192012 RepID=A0A5N6MVZ3_9ASTR|nr:hypothetical protein E3N88_26897 [Mikania micrantha]